MISVEAILEEYCDNVSSPRDNMFVCRLDTEYLIQLVQRLNVIDYTVTQMSYIHEGKEQCIIEVEKSASELLDDCFDDYGDDLYYK